MTFTEIYADSNYQILTSWPGYYVYKNERNYFKVVFLDINSKGSFKFNGYTYFGYSNNESVIIEVTDIARSKINVVGFTFYDDVDLEIYSFDFDVFSGFSQNEITKINLPTEIKVNFDLNPFHYICSTDLYDRIVGEAVITENSGAITSISDLLSQNNIFTKITEIDVCKYVLFRWISANGYKKDWYFLQDKLNISSDKSLQIDTGESDYKQFKNKKVSFSVIERMADLATQKYLSDLVISDDVKVYIDGVWMSVAIETNGIEISHRRKDLIFNVNFQHYDTI